MATYNPPKAQCWSNEPIPFIATPQDIFRYFRHFRYFWNANKSTQKKIFVIFVFFVIFGI